MSDVLVRVSGACGRITLNRPRALNALTLEMVSVMHSALMTWSNDASIQFVLVDGAGERGLCAGGDIRAMYTAVITDNQKQAIDFLRNEYRLNYLISRYPKPYVVLMDGIVMGGGIGISGHASHRVVTERSELAMPETAIGFIPDVGGTHLLGTAPDELGTYLGLTGNRIGAADAISCRLADIMVLSENLLNLMHDLEKCNDAVAVDDSLRAYTAQAPLGMTAEQRDWIKECFAAQTVEEIFVALAQHPHPEARKALEELEKKSPTSLKVTLAALRNARSFNDLASCLQQEYHLAQACLRQHDFVEGVRAAIVDKDRSPKWYPDRLDRVTPEDVQQYFSKSRMGELDLNHCLQ
jgi:enoyl-CoA hydratase